MSTNWMLDEIAHAGHEHLDEVYVAGYTAKAGYDPAEDVEALLARGAGPGSSVVDLGAGTGQFTRALAPHVGHVVAVDVSPAMLAVLDRETQQAGLTNVTSVHAGFMSYEHAGPLADAVFSRHALHQVPDFWKAIALRRIHDLLVPGGILRVRDLVYDVEPAGVPALVDAWVAGATTNSAAGWMVPELAEHVREEHGTFTWLFEPILEHAGFTIDERVVHHSLYATYTCTRD